MESFQKIQRNAEGVAYEYGKKEGNEEETQAFQDNGAEDKQQHPGCCCCNIE